MIRDFLITVDLPEWARWYAMDADGRVYVYESMPYLDLEECDHIWFAAGRMGRIQGVMNLNPNLFDWTQTRHKIERAG